MDQEELILEALKQLPPVPESSSDLTDRIMESLPEAQAQAALEHLPEAPGPDPELADRVMESLPGSHGAPAPWWRLLLRPVPVPAWALVLLVAAGATWMVLDGQSTRRGQPVPPAIPAVTAVEQKPPAPSPARPAPPRPMLVRFHLAAPAAREVSLVADFNGWSTHKTMLADPDGNGIWTVTVPLSQGRYHYRFLVDGDRWVVDPDATSFLADGFGGMNALLDI